MNATHQQHALIGGLLSVSLLQGAVGQPDRPATKPELLSLDQVAKAVQEQDFDHALQLLSTVLAAGYPTPSDVLHQPAFQPLTNDFDARKRLCKLLSQHVRESHVTIVQQDEPGVPMLYRIRVVERTNGKPVPGAVAKVVHVDAQGLYQALDQEWNPRIFGFARTDEEGYIEVRSIRPAHYAAEYEADEEPAHVHVSLDKVPGFIPLGTEFWLVDDPRVSKAAEKMPVAKLTKENKLTRAEVTIAIDRR